MIATKDAYNTRDIELDEFVQLLKIAANRSKVSTRGIRIWMGMWNKMSNLINVCLNRRKVDNLNGKICINAKITW